MTEENNVLNEEMELESTITSGEEEQDHLKEAVEKQLKKIRTQSLLLGAQTSCNVILQKIAVWEAQPGKRTLNDHRRLIKDIKRFCEIGVSKQVNSDENGDNTKLTDEENDNE